MLVLGIDPGSQRTGWGIVAEESGCLRLVNCGIIRTVAKSVQVSFSARMTRIYDELCAVIAAHEPDLAAVEQIFTAQNAQSALKLGQARGVAIAACAARGLEIHDYEPTLIKKALTGTGRADKEQVAFMVRRLLNIRNADWALDTSDALAAAICHLSQARFNALAQKTSASLAKS